ncbi:benzoate/H(+) symporter BenE family transporter [Nisaea sp.]|uniref:benzoate/H(+) symporter BenE family transporter n=1 Tax=Nisaea sp. TaxID=2024842 RepID=UPI002B274EB8|nr:benzoate/H(+) symporter BenE family transporter [Nisaea sp.]
MRSSIVISAFVAVVVGFGGSVAVVLAATKAVGATELETASWIGGLCLAMMATSGFLSVRHRLPVVTAWSTPGAALIAATNGVNMSSAVGAFLVAAALVLATAAFRSLGALVEKLPSAIASSMLAGVLFTFVLEIFGALQGSPALVLPLVGGFMVLRLVSPAWAVLLVLIGGIMLAQGLGMIGSIPALGLSEFTLIHPTFDPAVLIGVGVPLYLVTMASQNLPGAAVLRAAGYHAPMRSILTVTGLASLLTAPLGAHTSNLAAITASICTGPDAHPDPSKRWLCGPFYALGYGFLAIFGASVVAVFTSFPEALILTIAGLALLGPFVGAIGNGLAEERHRFAAAVTFVVTVSGIGLFGIGSAFWGLLAGLAVLGLDRLKAMIVR